MPKPLDPKDGRLKANRDFNTFMQRAVYAPFMRGDFKNDPTLRPEPTAADSEHERVMRAIRTRSVEGLSASDLTIILVHAVSAAQKVAEQEGDKRLSGILEFASRAADRVCTIVALRDD
jgi:hypothetical protein